MVIDNPIVILDHAPSDYSSHEDSIEMLHHVVQKVDDDLAHEREMHRAYVQRTTHEQETLHNRNRRLEEEKVQILEILKAEASTRVAVQERHRSLVQTTGRRMARLEEKHAAYKREIKDLRARQACICAICYSNVCDVVTLCGHQFCSTCFQRWHLVGIALGTGGTTCPTCRCALVRDEVLEKDEVAFKLHYN